MNLATLPAFADEETFHVVDWGFIPSTCGADGDPIDALLLWDTQAPHDPSVRIRNDRIVAVPIAAPREQHHDQVDSLDERLRLELENFAVIATDLEGKDVAVAGWGDAAAAVKLIRRASPRERHRMTPQGVEESASDDRDVSGADVAFSVVFDGLVIASGAVAGGAGRYATGAMWGPGFAALLTCRIYSIPVGTLGWTWGETRFQVASDLLRRSYSCVARPSSNKPFCGKTRACVSRRR